MNRKQSGRITRESRAAVIAVMLMSAIPCQAGDTSTYERLNTVLSGRMVTVGKKNGVRLEGVFQQIAGPTLSIAPKGGAKGGLAAPVRIAIDEVEYVEDNGRLRPKVAGALSGIAMGVVGGTSLAEALSDAHAGAIALVMAFVGGGAAAGTFIGKKLSTERYYLGPGSCVAVERSEPDTIGVGRQITLSGLAGATRGVDDPTQVIRGAQFSAQFPAGRKLKVVVDFVFTSSGAVRQHYEGTTTYDGATHWYVSDEETEEHSYEVQVVLRRIWREAARIRPYAEGGYGIAWHSLTNRVWETTDRHHYEDVFGESWFSWLRIVGGAGCEIGITPRIAADVRGQFAAGKNVAAHVSAGLKYGF